MKRFSAIALAVVMLFAFAACGNKTDKTDTPTELDSEYIKGKQTLIVGITDYAPMDYKDEDGNWTGFDAEFAAAVAEKLGVEVEFIEIDWDNKFLELESKSIDCIWNGMTISDEVINNTECSKAYVKNAQVVVMDAQKAESYTDSASMKDLSFAVESGSAGEDAAKENGFNYTAVTAQSDALMEVASGSVDACIIDITMANAMTGEGTNYAKLTSSLELTSEEYGVGFRKGSDMAEILNGYIDDLKTDGTLTALAEKYELTLAD